MTDPMYSASVPVLKQMLGALACVLDKTQTHAAARNIDATVLSTLLSEVRPSPPRKPRRRNAERLRSRVVASTQRSSRSESPQISVTAAVEETLW